MAKQDETVTLPVPDSLAAITAEALKSTIKKGSKSRVCWRRYHYADGTFGSRSRPEATQLDFLFAGGEVLSCKFDDLDEKMSGGFMGFGISERIGNAGAGVEGVTLAEKSTNFHEASAALWETICAGVWVEEGEKAGPRIGQVAEAVKRALEADGQMVDDNRMAAIVAKMADPDERKAALANDTFNAHYKAIQSERAAERAEKAMEKAGASDTADLGSF